MTSAVTWELRTSPWAFSHNDGINTGKHTLLVSRDGTLPLCRVCRASYNCSDSYWTPLSPGQATRSGCLHLPGFNEDSQRQLATDRGVLLSGVCAAHPYVWKRTQCMVFKHSSSINRKSSPVRGTIPCACWNTVPRLADCPLLQHRAMEGCHRAL